MSEGAQHSL